MEPVGTMQPWSSGFGSGSGFGGSVPGPNPPGRSTDMTTMDCGLSADSHSWSHGAALGLSALGTFSARDNQNISGPNLINGYYLSLSDCHAPTVRNPIHNEDTHCTNCIYLQAERTFLLGIPMEIGCRALPTQPEKPISPFQSAPHLKKSGLRPTFFRLPLLGLRSFPYSVPKHTKATTTTATTKTTTTKCSSRQGTMLPGRAF